MSLEPPIPGWVANAPAAHRPWVPSLQGEGCYWGDWVAPPGTGDIRYYQWGIGLRPNGTEILPFQYSPYTHEGRIPALQLPDDQAALPLYCTVRAITTAGVGATATSPAFRICAAVADANVSVPATQRHMRELCATWAVAPDDPGVGCVARYAWAIGHRPLGTSVMDFTEVPAGTGACARIPLQDGEEYYATLQLRGASGATAVFVSGPAHVDTTAPQIRELRLIVGVAGQGAAYAPKANSANLTASWLVSEPHSTDLGIALDFLRDDVVAATVALDAASHAGRHTVALPLVAKATYRCRARVRNRAGLQTSRGSNAVLVDGTAPSPTGQVRDGRDPRADAEWQQSPRFLAVTWPRFSDPESGVRRAEVCFGTAPGPLCDVSPFTPAMHPHLHVHEVVGVQPLAANVTYFGTVRVRNGAGLYTDVSSDGVTIDLKPPLFARTALVRLVGGGTATASHNVSVVWDAPEDGVSGVAGYTVDVGHQPYGSGIHRALPVGLALSTTLQLPQATPEYTFYIAVRATDRAGQSSAIRSQQLTLDTSPPEMGEILFAVSDSASHAQHTPPPLPSTRFYVFLEDCADEQTGVLQVSWWLRAPSEPRANALASGDVADWRRGWTVQDLALPPGRYYFGVEAENSVGLRARREAVLTVDSTAPSEGTVWDGPGAVDVQLLGMAAPVVTSWKGLWDPESDVTLVQYSLEEVTANHSSRTVVPWRKVSGGRCSVQAPLAVGRHYVSVLRVTNQVGLSSELRTNGFTVVHDEGPWVPGDDPLSSLPMSISHLVCNCTHSARDLPLAPTSSDMIRWSRILLSHTLDAARYY